jgi:hypothetical protein
MHTEGKYSKFRVNKTQRSGRTVITVINFLTGGGGEGRKEGRKVSHIFQKVNFNGKHNGLETKQQKAHLNRQYYFSQLHSLRL